MHNKILHIRVSRCSACGRRSSNISNVGPYIVGGQSARRGAWPWQTRVLLDGTACSGFLINDRWVVTAAHCTLSDTDVPVSAKFFQVRLGALQREGPDPDLVISSVDRVFTHPSYNSTLQVYDIGLLRLSRSMVFSDTVRPICLPESNVNLNKFKVCVSTGFGRITSGRPASVLMQARMDILSLSECYSYIVDFVGSTDFMSFNDTLLCLGPMPPGTISTCDGDSGGPLACQDQQGLWTAVGATSFGDDACTWSVNAFMPTFVDWIQRTIDNNRD